jgi:hypothetical protein
MLQMYMNDTNNCLKLLCSQFYAIYFYIYQLIPYYVLINEVEPL